MHILRFILYYVLLRWSFVYEMYLFPRDTSFHAPMMEICDVQGCKSNGIDTLLSAEKICRDALYYWYSRKNEEQYEYLGIILNNKDGSFFVRERKRNTARGTASYFLLSDYATTIHA